MGSYSHLTISDYPTFANKNGFCRDVSDLIFLPEDFVIEQRKNSARNKLVWGDTYNNTKGKYTFKGYIQTAKVCKQRLEIFGPTMLKTKSDFKAAKRIAKEQLAYDFALSRVSFNQYMTEISDIIEKKEINYELDYESCSNLRDCLIARELGIFGQSTQYHLYSILSNVPSDSIVEYDLTDVIYGGWVKENEAEEIEIEKIIVLTEGKTDVEFINGALRKLYPHLFPYFHFINFDEYKVESNASALVKFVISLAASNIKHPIIVLFDNDTTGIMEMNKLKSIKLGENFRILKLPDLKIAKKYPTLGPTGVIKMNVNGLACGIEMYLGQDALTKDGKLVPIQWKSFNERERKYQGDISDKLFVQEAFREKLKSNSISNFSDIDLILQRIFKAFSTSELV